MSYLLINCFTYYLQNDVKIKKRVTLALGLLIGAKVLNVSVPFLFKYAIDGLNTGLSMNTPLDAVTTAATTLMIGCMHVTNVFKLFIIFFLFNFCISFGLKEISSIMQMVLPEQEL